ncbi:MAG: biotin/lipoyl-containing protein [Rubrimonas sp.]|uniref:biotin/lipoyl-containing protein n=1 Tax=Rubrimonas sp. TaxID=2036015 RepID=UPI002FDEFF4F
MIRRLRITVDGKAYDVLVEEVAGEGEALPPPAAAAPAAASVASPGAPRPAAAPSAPSGPPGAGDAQRAPLAGTIASVAVSVGDVVAADQQLCVIEAMKMKTAINAMRGGKVTSVLVAPGDAVDADQPLVTIA